MTRAGLSVVVSLAVSAALPAQQAPVRWVAAPGEEIGMVGNAAAAPASGLGGELSLSHAATGQPGLMASHFIFEPF